MLEQIAYLLSSHENLGTLYTDAFERGQVNIFLPNKMS